MIHEIIVTTQNADGGVHIAPMGVRRQAERVVIAPFRPSGTLLNLERSGVAVLNHCEDVRIFAGCLTGRRDWPTRDASVVPGRYLEAALVHVELEIERVEADEVRPRFFCIERHREVHGAFSGYNRARAAVLEAAILISRLDRLPPEQVDLELAYLRNAVDKTAGEHEREAWQWLQDAVAQHRAGQRRGLAS